VFNSPTVPIMAGWTGSAQFEAAGQFNAWLANALADG
jgi:hypothetical protein